MLSSFLGDLTAGDMYVVSSSVLNKGKGISIVQGSIEHFRVWDVSVIYPLEFGGAIILLLGRLLL